MGSNCSRIVAKNLKDELWSYTALSGLLFLHIGIVLMVYALKRATPHSTVLKAFGIGLIVLGVMATLASWYAHRQHRLQRDLCLCCVCCSRHKGRSVGADLGAGEGVDSGHSRKGGHVTGKSKDKKSPSVPDNTIKLFSAPEFQRYAEFINGTTAGVQPKTARRESHRQKTAVHPQRPQALPQTELHVNPRTLQRDHPRAQLPAVASPILLKLSH
ncbi:uncharacterized protein LOC131940646 [Physella acuta]|uniref:uncharacterized protein LOC131940646 n=1 Tax=Physella acuta TaxID=109671 RepID=UPI0027DE2482|nr:uncharacterized protein LOC131940646 [Physella acuta]